ncbi:MAG TPA: peptide-methionine (S)-S-oxide reductase MsrA [Chitinophagales bacterium]|nr:peptide-methionine (S)-S-oxide reductase MsrA [Chitinophagales bacterium]
MRNTIFIPVLFMALLASGTSCGQKSNHNKTGANANNKTLTMTDKSKLDTITLGGGCFWCMEAIYQRLSGVVSVTSGYAGGKIANPTYREVCSGLTGHAESVQIVYDTSLVSLTDILHVFFKTHDPTTLNRQGADEGTQYRSVIFYRDEAQKKTAEEIKTGLDKSGAYNAPIVTEIAPFTNFYKAEDYHQNYFNDHKNSNPYCQIVIVPKLEKFEEYFSDKLKR